MKEKLLIASLVLLGIALFLYVIDFLMYHFLGEDRKFHKEFRKVPAKPYLTYLQGILGTIIFASSIITLVLALILY